MTGEMTIPQCCSHDYRLIFKGEYDVPMTEPPKSVLDIGANVGMFSVWAARLWPDAVISSYEPWDENVEMLKENTKAFRNVIVCPYAVRGSSGVSRMIDNVYSPLHSFRMGEGTTHREISHIDAADIPSHEFVKIDTEGCEIEILERLDLSLTKYVVLEAHSSSDAHKISDILTDKGFAVHDIHPAGTLCHLMKFIRRSVLVETKLFVAVPTYSGSPTSFWKCLLRLEKDHPCNISIQILEGDSLVSRARNTLTASFLRSDCTHMLFIDSDLIFSPDHVERIMSHEEPVVAGFYPKKQDGKLSWVCNALAGEEKQDNGLQSVRYMGTGFIRIARTVFEQMIERWGPQIAYHPDSAPHRTEYDLWPVGPYQYQDGNRRYLSEDWYFCQRWLDLGGKVYGDTCIVLKHIGNATYPLVSQIPQVSNPIVGNSNATDHA